MVRRLDFFSIPKRGRLSHEEKPEIANRELLRFLNS